MKISSSRSSSRTVLVVPRHRPRTCELHGFLGERAIAADPVDRTVAGGGNQPRPRVLGRPVARPPLHRDRERLLRGFLGEIEVAEEADQGGDDAAPFVAEDVLEDR